MSRPRSKLVRKSSKARKRIKERPKRKPALRAPEAAKPRSKTLKPVSLRPVANVDTMIRAATHLLDLKVDPRWVPAIRDHLQVTLRHAAFVAEFTLPDDAEPAPVFEA